MRLVLLAALAFFSAAAMAHGPGDAVRHAGAESWHAGTGLLPGDAFEYEVCDALRAGGGCYEIRLGFYLLLESGGRDVWVVQAEASEGNATARHVFLVDADTMEIHARGGGRAYAESVERTVLFLGGYAPAQFPKGMEVGDVWGPLRSFDPRAELAVESLGRARLPGGNVTDVSVVRYEFFEASEFEVSPDLPFPVSGILHDPGWPYPDPPVSFEFGLVGLCRASAPAPCP